MMLRLAVLAFLACTVLSEIDSKPDCSKLGDGIYAMPECSSSFYVCLASQLEVMNCTDNLFYDPISKMCDHKFNVAICNDKTDEDGKPDCSKVGDGIYAMHQCSPSFYYCADNRLGVMNCTGNLYFNPIKQLCDYKEQNIFCNDANREVEKPDCVKLGDGLHAKGCSSDFYACQNNLWYAMKCPSGFYFNPLTKSCKPKDQVPICAEAKDATLDCSKVEDGWYAKGCSQDFHGCWGKKLDVGHCSGDLYFNPLTNACEPKEKVPLCNDENDAKLDCSKVAPGWYAKGCSSDFHGCWGNELILRKCARDHYFNPLTHKCESKDKVPICNEAKDPKPDCRKGDGLHAKGCSNEFYLCSDNELSVMKCSGDLYFDQISRSCNYEEKVPICAERKDAKLDCKKVSEGWHVKGCSQEIQGCWGDKLVVRNCSGDLFYNPFTNACESKEKVPICNGIKDAKPDCSKVGVGAFARGCSANFYLCKHALLYSMTCPSGLYFDSLTEACEIKEKVPICNDVPIVDIE